MIYQRRHLKWIWVLDIFRNIWMVWLLGRALSPFFDGCSFLFWGLIYLASSIWTSDFVFLLLPVWNWSSAGCFDFLEGYVLRTLLIEGISDLNLQGWWIILYMNRLSFFHLDVIAGCSVCMYCLCMIVVQFVFCSVGSFVCCLVGHFACILWWWTSIWPVVKNMDSLDSHMQCLICLFDSYEYQRLVFFPLKKKNLIQIIKKMIIDHHHN